MRLAVTGAGGMLGRGVVEAARRLGHDVVALARGQLDVTDAGAVHRTLRELTPTAVLNCAAWTDVDGAEAHEGEARAVNAAGAGHVAAAAHEVGARLVHVSTDYVFDGRADRPYVESDAPAPRSAYGRTKLEGERRVAQANPAHAIVRTAWLFGAGGRNFVDTMLRLCAERDEVQVVADQIGCPTWTGHLAPALVELAEREGADWSGVHHLAGAGRCSWYELAVEVFDRAGVHCRVVPTTSDAFPRPAPRPAWSVLGTERAAPLALPAWQEGVGAYVTQRAPMEANAR